MRKVIQLIIVVAFLSVSFSTNAMGWETSSQISYRQGRCAYIRTEETFYFLGIAWGTRVSTDIVGCDPGSTTFYTPAPL